MRLVPLLAAGFLVVIPAACTSAPPITVVRTAAGEKVEDVKGDVVKLKRGNKEAYVGAKGGYYVVRTQQDWESAWPAGRVPPMPSLDSNKMVFLAVSGTQDVTRMRIERAMETGSFLYVWVRENTLGEGCRKVAGERALDAVTLARTEKPVKFIVDEEREDSCGEPPTANVECRLAKQQTWTKKVEAQPGDTVECMLTAAARGRFELVDKFLSMTELPPGSTAKLAFKNGAERGELELDVYGNYALQAEAADESGRRAHATATIEVKPPKTKDVLVQLVWAGFDRSDMPDTFPRVNLRVAEEGPKGQRCSAQIPIPGLCDVKTRGAYTYMRIPEGSRKLPISVQYTDERVENGPGPCIHVWYDGVRTAETCDRRHRDGEEIWKVGVLDTSTGALALDDPPPTPASTSDAGAAPAADAGARK